MQYISILSTLVSFAFAVAVFNRYRQRGGLHLLFWTVGLVFYGLGTLTEVLMLVRFSPVVLKVWYLSGAMMTAAWLGQGTVNLLVRKHRLVRLLNIALVIISLVTALLLALAPITSAASAYNLGTPVSSQYKEILVRSGFIVALTILLNLYGTVTLVGGALYSAFLFWRKKILFNRMIGNILIAAGAMFPAMGGTFLKAGMPDWLYLSELLGVLVMYIGFLQATAQPAAETVPAPQAGD